MNITPLAVSTAAVRLSPDQAAKALADAKAARQQQIDSQASQVISSPRLKANDMIKEQAKARVIELAKVLTLFKKLYAQDPKGMARAIASMAKELKAAIKDYEAADKDELAQASDMVTAMNANLPAANGSTTDSAADDAKAADTSTPDATTATASADASATGASDASASEYPTQAAAAVAAGAGTSTYNAVMGEVRDAIGLDGRDFLNTVRDLAKQMSEALETSRGWAVVKYGADKTRAMFKDVDKAMGALHDEIDTFRTEINDIDPPAGSTLSIAA